MDGTPHPSSVEIANHLFCVLDIRTDSRNRVFQKNYFGFQFSHSFFQFFAVFMKGRNVFVFIVHDHSSEINAMVNDVSAVELTVAVISEVL